jgi:hypothetical protein
VTPPPNATLVPLRGCRYPPIGPVDFEIDSAVMFACRYLMTLWNRLVNSIPYLGGTAPSLLENYSPQIVRSYVMARLQGVQVPCLPVLFTLPPYVGWMGFGRDSGARVRQ